tara:strand:- start:3647 stop:4243 length:597 start_codon:yes stop_codon:yes gene_type:complete
MKFIYLFLCITSASAFLHKPKIEQPKPMIPDVYKRDLMNKILLTSLGTSCGPLLYGYLNFFAPRIPANSENGVIAKDKYGGDVTLDEWTKSHPYPDRALVEGPKGDAHYLITTSNGKLENFALNAVCTHLGCVVPWNPSENKFMCPCHGSQYNSEGKVVRGPAPKSLALAQVNVQDNTVYLSTWKKTDFRTNEDPWWT